MRRSFFRVIKGRYHIMGYKPDGDSLRFAANNAALFNGLYRERVSNSPSGEFQLRLEGIDAPETHYASEGQPHGNSSRDKLLSLLGVHDVKLDAQRVVYCVPEFIPGTILTRAFDTHGRPISYALLGDRPDLPEGSELEVTPELLSQTLNAQMVMEGFAYPLLYTSTPEPHRDWLRAQGGAAREKKAGVWGGDSSRTFLLVNRDSVCDPDGKLIYPKFFRRCVDYLHQRESALFTGDLPAWLFANQLHNDHLLISGRETALSDVFEHKDQTVNCQADLLDMVFIEK